MSSPVDVLNPSPPIVSTDKKPVEVEPTFGAWLESLLLPPRRDKLDKCEPKKTDGATSSLFCNIPALMSANCCADSSTVETTKVADDQSHSTISEENNQETGAATEAKPDASPSPQTWESYFADLNNNLCGKPTVEDGLPPPTINFASPIKTGSSQGTADKDNTVVDTQDEIAAASIVLDSEVAKVEPQAESKVEPEPAQETDPEENEAVANETIVVYYSGDEDPKEAEPEATVVLVELDPTDDAIMQERARAENAEANNETTGEIVRFDTLATGSFCEVAGDAEDVPMPKEEALVEKAALVDLPLLEEEESSTELASQQDEEMDHKKEEAEAAPLETLIEDENEEKEAMDLEEEPKAGEDLITLPEEREDIDEIKTLENDQVEKEEETKDLEEEKPLENEKGEADEEKDAIEPVATDETHVAVQPSSETAEESSDLKEPEAHPAAPGVERRGSAIKIISLLSGVFDITQGGLHDE